MYIFWRIKWMVEDAIVRLVARMEHAIGWMTMSGLKINTSKTEICLFLDHNKHIQTFCSYMIAC